MKETDPMSSYSDKSKYTHLASQKMLAWSSFCADIFEDTFAGILGFIPNGIDTIYDGLFKKIPVIGRIFEAQTLETLLKLVLGVTIGKGIAIDAAKYIFRPIGFLTGALLGSTFLASLKAPMPYKGKIGEIFYKLSGQTVLGAIIGLLTVILGFSVSQGLGLTGLNAKILLLAVALGASIGLIAKAMLLLAVNIVNQANAANLRKSVKRAKNLSEKLKEIAKQKAKSRVYQEAQDLIQKMNGPQSQERLGEFLQSQYDAIFYHTNQKINRHFDYLADRACCGDMQALKKLQTLIPQKHVNKFNNKSPLEIMIDRIFNQRTLFQLRDDIDNSYDCWRYKL